MRMLMLKHKMYLMCNIESWLVDELLATCSIFQVLDLYYGLLGNYLHTLTHHQHQHIFQILMYNQAFRRPKIKLSFGCTITLKLK